MPDPLRRFRDMLLRGGVPPKAARRYVAELREHREDIVAELLAGGMTPAIAAELAARRLGDPDEIAAHILADRRGLSLARRFPALTWLATPVVVLLALIAGCAALLVGAVRSGLSAGEVAVSFGPMLWSAPLVLCWMLALSALRRRADCIWPLAGMLATLLLGAMLRLETLPESVSVSLVTPSPVQLALHGLLAVLPFLALDRMLKVS